MGRFRLKALQQARPNTNNGDFAAASQNDISKSIDALLEFYCNTEIDGDDKFPKSDRKSQENSSMCPFQAIQNLPKMEKSQMECDRGSDLLKGVQDSRQEAIGNAKFLNILKNNESEWYDVLSDYFRQMRAQKNRKNQAAKIFRRTAVLVKAAISFDALTSETPQYRSQPSNRLPEFSDSSLPEGNHLVGKTVKLLSAVPAEVGDAYDSCGYCLGSYLSAVVSHSCCSTVFCAVALFTPDSCLVLQNSKSIASVGECSDARGNFLCGREGEALVLCAVWSGSSSVGRLCSGYMVEWLHLSQPESAEEAAQPSDTFAELPQAQEAAGRLAGEVNGVMYGPGDDGLDYVPASHMHVGRFVPAFVCPERSS